MGKGIVYCGDCGKALHEDDFAKGLAHEVNDCPYCTSCRAMPEPPPVVPMTSSSTRIRSAKVTSGRVPKVATPPPSTVRRVTVPAAGDSRRMVVIGAGVAGGAVLLLVVVLVVGGGAGEPERKPAPPSAGGGGNVEVRKDPKPAVRTSEAGAEAEVFRKLAAFAETSKDPNEILMQCDMARKALRGTAFEKRMEEIEKRALEARQLGGWERQINHALEEVRRIREDDKELRKETEIVRMLEAASRMARHRKPEVDKALEDYQTHRVTHRLSRADRIQAEDPFFLRAQEVEELLGQARDASPQKRVDVEKRLAAYAQARKASPVAGKMGPYDLDDSGYICQWLLVGPFPNDEDKGLEVDFLKGEPGHAPAEGKEIERVGKPRVKWGQHVTADAIVHFFKVSHLGLKDGEPSIVNYGAAWILSEDAQDVQVRVSTDDGYRLWMEGREIGGKHQHRGVNPGEDHETIPVRLSRGLQRILIKVDQGDGGHEFKVRITKPDGSRADKVRIFN